jgi:hypothetical protein
LAIQGVRYKNEPLSPRRKQRGPASSPVHTRRVVGWTLSDLAATTAEELVARALPEGSGSPSSEALARALAAAKGGGLSTDAVWQRAWTVSPKAASDVAMLAEHLSHDGSFLAHAALALDSESVPTAAALLHHALAASTGPTQQRLRLLAVSDLATTYREIHGDAADMGGLRALVAAGPAEAAAAFAQSGNIAALQTLFKNHPNAIAPTALSVLSNLPPDVGPQDYLPLLQCLAKRDLPEPRRAADSAESPENLNYPGAVKEQLPERALAALGTSLPMSEEIDAWVLERAKVIDDEGGMVDRALALLKAWAVSGHCAVAAPAVALHMWLAVLKRACAGERGAGPELAEISVREFLSMSPPAQLRFALMSSLPEDMPTAAAADVITEVRSVQPNVIHLCLGFLD